MQPLCLPSGTRGTRKETPSGAVGAGGGTEAVFDGHCHPQLALSLGGQQGRWWKEGRGAGGQDILVTRELGATGSGGTNDAENVVPASAVPVLNHRAFHLLSGGAVPVALLFAVSP